jgi:hypothetical protein
VRGVMVISNWVVFGYLSMQGRLFTHSPRHVRLGSSTSETTTTNPVGSRLPRVTFPLVSAFPEEFPEASHTRDSYHTFRVGSIELVYLRLVVNPSGRTYLLCTQNT